MVRGTCPTALKPSCEPNTGHKHPPHYFSGFCPWSTDPHRRASGSCGGLALAVTVPRNPSPFRNPCGHRRSVTSPLLGSSSPGPCGPVCAFSPTSGAARAFPPHRGSPPLSAHPHTGGTALANAPFPSRLLQACVRLESRRSSSFSFPPPCSPGTASHQQIFSNITAQPAGLRG